jgi:hypothetical protein
MRYSREHMIETLEKLYNNKYASQLDENGEITVTKDEYVTEEFTELMDSVNYITENLPNEDYIKVGSLNKEPITHYGDFDFIYDICPRIYTVKCISMLSPEDMLDDKILEIYNSTVKFIKKCIFVKQDSFEDLVKDCTNYITTYVDSEFIYKVIIKLGRYSGLPEEYDPLYLNNQDILIWRLTLSDYHEKHWYERYDDERKKVENLVKENNQLKLDNDDLRTCLDESNKSIEYEEDQVQKVTEIKCLESAVQYINLKKLINKLKSWMCFFIGTTVGSLAYIIYLVFFVEK